MRLPRLVLPVLAGALLLAGAVSWASPETASTVYITKTGQKYHLKGCRYLSQSSIAITLEDAVAAGYTPCRVCSPEAMLKPESADTDTLEHRNLTPVSFIRVVDGDTLHLRFQGRDEAVRLIGIDTPELHYRRGHPNYPEPFATEASDYLKRMVAERALFLELDVEKRDRYRRLLGYLWARGEGGSDLILVNAQLLRAGLAQILTIPPNVKHVDRFLAAQRKARSEGIGLWKVTVLPPPAS